MPVHLRPLRIVTPQKIQEKRGQKHGPRLAT
jgi:hypothetical protein